MAAARYSFGFIRPRSVTMACRPASASFPTAMSKSVLHSTSDRLYIRRPAGNPSCAVTAVLDRGDVQTVALGDGLPVKRRRAADRFRADPHARSSNRIEVDDAAELLDIVTQQIARCDRHLGERDSSDTPEFADIQSIHTGADPRGGRRGRGHRRRRCTSTNGRRAGCRWRDHDSVRQSVASPVVVVTHDRPANDR